MAPTSRLALALLLVCLLCALAITENATAIPYKIEGYLTDVHGDPIPSVNISVSGEQYDPITQAYTPMTHYIETDENGYYVIHVAGNEPGGYPLGSEMIIQYDSGTNVVRTAITIDGSPGTWANLTYDQSAPFLDKIVISPESAKLRVSGSVILTAQGYDQYNNPIYCSPSWADDSGQGTFTNISAGNPATVTYLAGSYEAYEARISASDGDVVGTVNIKVRESGLSDLLLSPLSLAVILIVLTTVVAIVIISRSSEGSNHSRPEEIDRPRVERRRRQR